MSRKVPLRGEAWTIYGYGDTLALCSRHRTTSAAIKAARRCEKRGGLPHQVVRVTPVQRKFWEGK